MRATKEEAEPPLPPPPTPRVALRCVVSEATLRLMIAEAIHEISGRPAFEAVVEAGARPRARIDRADRLWRTLRAAGDVRLGFGADAVVREPNAGQRGARPPIVDVRGITDAAPAARFQRLMITGRRAGAEGAIRIGLRHGLRLARGDAGRQHSHDSTDTRGDERGSHG